MHPLKTQIFRIKNILHYIFDRINRKAQLFHGIYATKLPEKFKR